MYDTKARTVPVAAVKVSQERGDWSDRVKEAASSPTRPVLLLGVVCGEEGEGGGELRTNSLLLLLRFVT